MGILTQITHQLGQMLNSQSAARRLVLLALIFGSVIGLGWMTMHARTGTMVVLYEDLPPGDGVTAAAKLHQARISAKLEEGGSRLKVSSRDADQAMMLLAMEGIPSAGVVGWEALDKNTMGQSKAHQEKNFHRMQQGELARTLMSMVEVERANVHLAIPEDNIFAEETAEPTASVVLKLRHGVQLSNKQINGIIHMISHAVEGLKDENVSVIDHFGNLLSTGGTGESQYTAMQMSYKSNYEKELKQKIESMLEKITGRGKVVARVQADFDYQKQKEVREIYNPLDQDPILNMERKSTDITRSENKNAGIDSTGVSGSDSNVPVPEMASVLNEGSDSPMRYSTDETNEYAVSKSLIESSQTMPVLHKVSVALLVDGIYEPTGVEGEAPVFRERTEEELDKLLNLTKSAIGFTQDRKINREDQITIECMPFKLDSIELLENEMLSPYLRRLIEVGIEWLMLGFIALLLITMVLRPAIKSVLVTPDEVSSKEHLPSGAAKPSLEAATGGEESSEGLSEEEFNAVKKLDALRQDNGVETLDSESIEKLLASENHGLTADEVNLLKSMANDQGRPQQMQSLLANQAMSTQAKAHELRETLADTVKHNAHHTVGLMRAWMEEA